MLKLEGIRIGYHKCNDGKWAAHTTVFDPRDKQHYMQVGFGRRKEHARKDLVKEVINFMQEILNESNTQGSGSEGQACEGAAT
jgi:hypothetical protein